MTGIIIRSLLIIMTMAICQEAITQTDKTPLYSNIGTVGFEQEWVNRKIKSEIDQYDNLIPITPKTDTAMKKVVSALQKKCPDCKFWKRKRKHSSHEYQLTFQDGLKVNLAKDPGCIETQLGPLTVAELLHSQNQLQLYNTTLQQQGLRIEAEDMGATHMHIGIESTFGNNAALFRDFIVDYHNNTSLALGVIGRERVTAPALIELGDESNEAFKKIITKFDLTPGMTIEELSKLINESVYNLNRVDTRIWTKTTPGSRAHKESIQNQAIGLKRVNLKARSERTLEIRAIRAHQDTKDLYLLAKLFLSRIIYLAQQNTRVTVTSIVPRREVDQFYQYVVESGLYYNDFDRLLPAYMQSQTPSKTLPFKNLSWSHPNSMKEELDWLKSQDRHFEMNMLLNILASPQNFPHAENQHYLEQLIKEFGDSKLLRDLPKIFLEREYIQSSPTFSKVIEKLLGVNNPALKHQLSRSLHALRKGLNNLTDDMLATLLSDIISSDFVLEELWDTINYLPNLSTEKKRTLLFKIIKKLEKLPELLHGQTRALKLKRPYYSQSEATTIQNRLQALGVDIVVDTRTSCLSNSLKQML